MKIIQLKFRHIQFFVDIFIKGPTKDIYNK